MRTFALRGHVALVTGGSRGIGAAIVRALGEAGCAVAVNYRERATEADALAKAIVSAGGKSFDLATLTVVCRKNDDRQLLRCRLSAQQTAQGNAINVGQLHIDHDQVAALLMQESQGRMCISSGDGAMAGVLQDAAHVFPRDRIVIDNEQRRGSCIGIGGN